MTVTFLSEAILNFVVSVFSWQKITKFLLNINPVKVILKVFIFSAEEEKKLERAMWEGNPPRLRGNGGLWESLTASEMMELCL